MKKYLVMALFAVSVLTMVGCGSSNKEEVSVETNVAQETVTITSLNGSGEKVELEVPFDPQRIAILDLASLDILDSLGLGDRVVGSADTSIDYLGDYANNEEIANLGTIKEADMEAVMACEPDVIFIGGRLAASYDALSEIAPVVYLATDIELGLVESVSQNATTIASMFGKEEEVAAKIAEFKTRVDALAAVGKDQTALVGMCTSGSFNLLGDTGRCSIIGNELGFNNIGTEFASSDKKGENKENTSSHGNESSFELIKSLNPQYIFVLDRDAAINTEGAQLAKDIMNNELVNATDAYKNGNVVYIENPAVWYTAEGGISAMDIMLSDLEAALLK